MSLPLRYRLFLGVLPDPDAVEPICNLQLDLRQQLGLRGKFRPPDILHVSLHHIGDYPEIPENIIEKTIEGCTETMPRRASFEVSFNQVKRFGRRALALAHSDGNRALKEFRRQFVSKLAKHGLATRGNARFDPHVTLLYDDHQTVSPLPVPPIDWQMTTVVLILSHVGETRYDRLRSWALEE